MHVPLNPCVSSTRNPWITPSSIHPTREPRRPRPERQSAIQSASCRSHAAPLCLILSIFILSLVRDPAPHMVGVIGPERLHEVRYAPVGIGGRHLASRSHIAPQARLHAPL